MRGKYDLDVIYLCKTRLMEDQIEARREKTKNECCIGGSGGEDENVDGYGVRARKARPTRAGGEGKRRNSS